MKRILFTTTSLVMLAGVASAETSISWSGVATAGIARDGAVAAVATKLGATVLADLKADYGAVVTTAAAIHVTGTTTTATVSAPVTLAATAATTETALRTEIATAKALLASKTSSGTAKSKGAVVALDAILTLLNAGGGSDAAVAGKFKTYSEVNATVTGSVTTDNNLTLSASMSVDAGTGYTFADDETFDGAKGGATLDNITLNAGAMGTLKLDEGAIEHLVDAGDDTNADLLYTNTFGSISFSAAMDVSEDLDPTAVKAVAALATDSDTSSAAAGDVTVSTAAVAAVAADVQWSAKVSMPVSGGTAYAAMDEEGGNAFGASTTVGGIGLTFDSKLEALEEEISADRSNTIGLTYVMGAVTTGATWNSDEDGDQWGISMAYAADGMAISASTDEGSDWSISGSYAMGSGASVVGGMNYTEDAYLGLSFAF